MSTLRKMNQHTPPSEHTRASQVKTYTPARIRDIAHGCGLVASQMKIGGCWDWHISTRDGIPCFQGRGDEAALWLQGFQRCHEMYGREE